MGQHFDISVIIPAYNVGNLITRTLDSIQLQTKLPYEVIVIDDGSTDNTRDVIKNYSDKYRHLNIRLITIEHQGASAARNTGIGASNCDWIAFLDSDDLWCKDKIEQVTNIIAEYKCINFICHNEVHKKTNGLYEFVDYNSMRMKLLPIPCQLYMKNFFSTSAVVCQRDLLIKLGGFDTSYRNAQDFEMWLRISPLINLFFLSDFLGVYVHRNGSITSENFFIRLKNVRRALRLHRKKVPYVFFAYSQARLALSYCRANFEFFKSRLSRNINEINNDNTS